MLRARPTAFRATRSTSAPLGNFLVSVSRFTSAVGVRNGTFLKPRFGMRRYIGTWPPSKPRPRLPLPVRAVWPLPPKPAVLPLPELSPRPRRLRFTFAPSGALRSCRRIGNLDLVYACALLALCFLALPPEALNLRASSRFDAGG